MSVDEGAGQPVREVGLGEGTTREASDEVGTPTSEGRTHLDHARPSPEADSKADVLLLCNLATGFIEQKEYDKARSLLRQAQEIADHLNDQKAQGRVGMTFCRLHCVAGDLEEARNHGFKALEALRKHGDPDEVALATIYLGNVERTQANLSKAKALYERAREVLCDSKNRRLLTLVHWALGNVACDLECTSEAYEHYQIALETAGTLVNAQERASLQMGLALSYRERGELDKALELSTKALHTFEEAGEMKMIASLHNNIGSIYMLHGDRSTARESYGRALDLLDSESVPQAAEAYRELARLDMEEGRLDEAVKRARAASRIALAVGSNLEGGRCSLVLAQALLGVGEIEAAVVHLPRAQAVFVEFGLRQSAIVATQLIQDAATLRGARR